MEKMTEEKKKKTRNELNRLKIKIQEKHNDGIPDFGQNICKVKYAEQRDTLHRKEWGVGGELPGRAGLGSAHWRRESVSDGGDTGHRLLCIRAQMYVWLHTLSGGSRETFIYSFKKTGFVEAADWTSSGSPVTGVWNTTVLQQIRVRVKVILQCHVHLLRICQLETGSYSWMISL